MPFQIIRYIYYFIYLNSRWEFGIFTFMAIMNVLKLGLTMLLILNVAIYSAKIVVEKQQQNVLNAIMNIFYQLTTNALNAITLGYQHGNGLFL